MIDVTWGLRDQGNRNKRVGRNAEARAGAMASAMRRRHQQMWRGCCFLKRERERRESRVGGVKERAVLNKRD
jgi:hypothetical protein